MTNWSYGVGESLNFIIPNVKGGGSGPYLLDENLMENNNVSTRLKNFVKDAYQKGLKNVPNVNYENLESLREEIINLQLDDGNDVIEKFVENQNRDGDDRARYSSLYGFDYGNLSGYDIVVNTSNKEADQVISEVVNELEKFGFKIN